MGMPMRDGLRLVHNTLVGAGLRAQVRLGASGKILSAFDIARCVALGADWCNSARGFMFAIGCIQSRSCHTDACPTGVATQDPVRQRALVVPDKAERVYRYHANTIHMLSEMMGAAGLSHPSQITADLLMTRDTNNQAVPFSSKETTLEQGALLGNPEDLQRLPEPFASHWLAADASRFGVVERLA